MKPQPFLRDGKTEASTLLLSHVHGSESFIESSIEWYNEKYVNALFIYMLKILTEGLHTESSIFDEFMD